MSTAQETQQVGAGRRRFRKVKDVVLTVVGTVVLGGLALYLGSVALLVSEEECTITESSTLVKTGRKKGGGPTIELATQQYGDLKYGSFIGKDKDELVEVRTRRPTGQPASSGRRGRPPPRPRARPHRTALHLRGP